ncbi:MAG TPA: hypothetical protein EYP02_08370, partial [Sulfurovum sp.]|nr:hypothetical protein [Sulfurovum sp.]
FNPALGTIGNNHDAVFLQAGSVRHGARLNGELYQGGLMGAGEIGKNFGAGMSGGIAYIYDEHDTLSKRINDGMVDLDRIETNADSDEVKAMIENYIKYTGSKEAGNILTNWEDSKKRFIKVMPRDYKRVLQSKKVEVENRELALAGEEK